MNQYTDNDELYTSIGNEIINTLCLKVKKNGRVDTTWGDKTPLGLALTMRRIVCKEDDES